jgi:hypothetical protein
MTKQETYDKLYHCALEGVIEPLKLETELMNNHSKFNLNEIYKSTKVDSPVEGLISESVGRFKGYKQPISEAIDSNPNWYKLNSINKKENLN